MRRLPDAAVFWLCLALWLVAYAFVEDEPERQVVSLGIPQQVAR